MPDPKWFDEEEWGPWETEEGWDHERRFHKKLMAVERRCRHCKKPLKDFPLEQCQNETCQALNIIAKQKSPVRVIADLYRQSKEEGE